MCFQLPHVKIYVISGLKELQIQALSYLGVTLCKYFTGNDAALLLCPGFPVWVCGARVFGLIGIWASRRHFPAIGKLQHISYHRLTACSKVIVSIAIVVSTKATDMSLCGDKHKIMKISKVQILSICEERTPGLILFKMGWASSATVLDIPIK